MQSSEQVCKICFIINRKETGIQAGEEGSVEGNKRMGLP
jgi:hypothetical protein